MAGTSSISTGPCTSATPCCRARREILHELRDAGRPVLFLSNNPLRTRADYAAKLTRLGIPAVEDDVINSSYVLVRHLIRTAAQARLLVIGEPSVKREMEDAGLMLTDEPAETDIVVACFDRTFDYDKLQRAFDAIRAGARFIATNGDPYCPAPGGGLPDCGAIIAAIETATGHRVEAVMGKPSPIMADVILARLALAPPSVLITGDRLETDIALARTAGMASALVLTGATDAAGLAASSIRPDYVLTSLSEILPAPGPA